MQIAIHAIGDKANDEVTALYQSLLPVSLPGNVTDISNPTGTVRRRHRVEHVQHLSGSESLEAFREAGVVAVTNPLHLMSDLDIIEARLGKGRAQPGLAFPSKALLQVCTDCDCQITSSKLHMLIFSQRKVHDLVCVCSHCLTVMPGLFFCITQC